MFPSHNPLKLLYLIAPCERGMEKNIIRKNTNTLRIWVFIKNYINIIMTTSTYELRKYIDILTEQENLTTSNLEIIKSLVKPEVQARFRDRAKQNPRQAAGTLQHQLQAVRNLAQWEDPLTILQYALNVGANPEELVKIMPQNMDLRSAPPQGTMSQHNQQLLKMGPAP